MEQPDWGYVQLGTFALLLGGLRLVDQHRLEKARPFRTAERERVQAGT